MCRRVLAIVLIVFVSFAFMPVEGYAGSAVQSMGDKASRGLVNTLTGFMEIPAQAVKGANRGVSMIDNKPTSHTAGMLLGVMRGVSHGAGRTASGVSDLAGFWAADYSNNDGYGQMLDAEYSWEDGTYHSLTEPNLMDGIKPIPMKGIRGIENVVLSPLAIPGHTMLSAKEDGNVVKGLFMGSWYGVSHLYDGAMDAATFLLPNPENTVGMKFKNDKPYYAMEEALK